MTRCNCSAEVRVQQLEEDLEVLGQQVLQLAELVGRLERVVRKSVEHEPAKHEPVSWPLPKIDPPHWHN